MFKRATHFTPSFVSPGFCRFFQVGISGISMFSGQAPVMARAMASAKSMKKAFPLLTTSMGFWDDANIYL